MRVTQSMLTNNMLRQLSNSYALLGKYQEQVQTGKKISRPSDDPVVAMKGMSYRTNLTEVEQYKRNLSTLYNWMDNAEAGLEQANAVLQRVRELVLQASNDTNNEDDRKSIQAEIKQLKDDLVQIANTQVAGKYIFNGTDITNPPVKTNPDGSIDEISINTEAFIIEVSKDVTLRANINAENVFNEELFTTLQDIENALNSNNEDVSQYLGDLDEHINNLIAERTELGARYNRVELVEDRLGKQEVIANQILSDNEDIEFERALIDLKTQESIHRAALGVGARIIQPTLLDFLR